MTMTDNQPSTVDADAFTVTRSIRIAAPIDAVWQAVTRPEHISRWFGQTELEGPGAGAQGTMTFPGHGTIPIRIERVEEPRVIVYRWNNDDALGEFPGAVDEAHSTVFTFTLEEMDGGTELTVVEAGFDQTSDAAANMADHAGGWTSELDKLVALLEADA